MEWRQFVLGIAGSAIPRLAEQAFGRSAALAARASLQALLIAT